MIYLWEKGPSERIVVSVRKDLQSDLAVDEPFRFWIPGEQRFCMATAYAQENSDRHSNVGVKIQTKNRGRQQGVPFCHPNGDKKNAFTPSKIRGGYYQKKRHSTTFS